MDMCGETASHYARTYFNRVVSKTLLGLELNDARHIWIALTQQAVHGFCSTSDQPKLKLYLEAAARLSVSMSLPALACTSSEPYLPSLAPPSQTRDTIPIKKQLHMQARPTSEVSNHSTGRPSGRYPRFSTPSSSEQRSQRQLQHKPLSLCRRPPVKRTLTRLHCIVVLIQALEAHLSRPSTAPQLRVLIRNSKMVVPRPVCTPRRCRPFFIRSSQLLLPCSSRRCRLFFIRSRQLLRHHCRQFFSAPVKPRQSWLRSQISRLITAAIKSTTILSPKQCWMTMVYMV
jgi:hypothetical protein